MTVEQKESLRKALIQQILSQQPGLKTLIDDFNTLHEPIEDVEPISSKDLIEDNRLLLQELKDANTNNQELIKLLEANEKASQGMRTTIQQLAMALGACPKCFGQDTNCQHCYGEGKPGTKPIHQELFQVYINPVLRKLKF